MLLLLLLLPDRLNFFVVVLKMPVVLSTIGKRYLVLSDSVENEGVLEENIHHL